MRIIFLGTPDFAVAALNAIQQSAHEVVAVVTMPDKPAGRGHKLKFSPVKEYALKHNLPLLQPTNLKDPEFVESLKGYAADLQVVVAFRMLPEVVWNMPAHGTVNIHGSLLPQYRGAAPINWAIINGEKETGVTTFQLKHAIDTGNIIDRATIAIHENDTAGIVHDKLMALGAEVIVPTIDKIALGTAEGVPQDQIDTTTLKHAPKIFKADCEINWNQPAEAVHNFIRGLSPFPTAFGILKVDNQELNIKIYETEVFKEHLPSLPAGNILVHNDLLLVSCQDGFIQLNQLQKPGKKRMDASSFLNGMDLPEGTSFK